ncbi:hypothetical protein E2C01_053118 [Portunus trituberculatus]|uniref:Uncharacterized protein n=1 Tax=Portunus trituberculatus TaxID=210409 RepID=A0A5B7GJG8_PORTR|nr:hypothetical protein [Portunus trituberculatus]
MRDRAGHHHSKETQALAGAPAAAAARRRHIFGAAAQHSQTLRSHTGYTLGGPCHWGATVVSLGGGVCLGDSDPLAVGDGATLADTSGCERRRRAGPPYAAGVPTALRPRLGPAQPPAAPRSRCRGRGAVLVRAGTCGGDGKAPGQTRNSALERRSQGAGEDLKSGRSYGRSLNRSARDMRDSTSSRRHLPVTSESNGAEGNTPILTAPPPAAGHAAPVPCLDPLQERRGGILVAPQSKAAGGSRLPFPRAGSLCPVSLFRWTRCDNLILSRCDGPHPPRSHAVIKPSYLMSSLPLTPPLPS